MQRTLKKKMSEFGAIYNTMYGDSGMNVKTVTWVITEACPLRCTYCYEINKHQRATMSFETIRKSVDMLFNEELSKSRYLTGNWEAKAIILDIIGGEPFEAIDELDYLVEYFRARAIELNHPWAVNHMISITTNGIYYFNDKVQDFLIRNEGRVSLTITIDGNKELHDACRVFPDGSGSYDIVEKAIKQQLNDFSEVYTKLTLAPENVEHTFEAIKNLYKLGLDGVSSNCVYEEGWNIDHAKILYDQLKKLADFILDNELYYSFTCTLFDEMIGSPLPPEENKNWCGGTGEMLAIGPDGKLYPCLRYMSFSLDDSVKPIIIGDVDNGIEHTEEQRNCVDCLWGITRQSQSTEECFNCPIASGCAWCSAYNYQRFGTPNKRATFICPMHKARVLANRYYWQKLYKKLCLPKKFDLNVPEEWALEIISQEEFDMLKSLG